MEKHFYLLVSLPGLKTNFKNMKLIYSIILSLPFVFFSCKKQNTTDKGKEDLEIANKLIANGGIWRITSFKINDGDSTFYIQNLFANSVSLSQLKFVASKDPKDFTIKHGKFSYPAKIDQGTISTPNMNGSCCDGNGCLFQLLLPENVASIWNFNFTDDKNLTLSCAQKSKYLIGLANE